MFTVGETRLELTHRYILISGYEPLCPHVKLSGYTVDGSFQQYAVSYTRMLTKIPDGLPLEVSSSAFPRTFPKACSDFVDERIVGLC